MLLARCGPPTKPKFNGQLIIQQSYLPELHQTAWSIYAPSAAKQTGVTNNADFINRLRKYPNNSIKLLVIDGHGSSANCGSSDIHLDTLTDEEMAVLISKLAPDGEIQIWACDVAATQDSRQRIQGVVNRLGHPIWANTRFVYTPLGGFRPGEGLESLMMLRGPWYFGLGDWHYESASSDGTWLQFKPGQPVPDGGPDGPGVGKNHGKKPKAPPAKPSQSQTPCD